MTIKQDYVPICCGPSELGKTVHLTKRMREVLDEIKSGRELVVSHRYRRGIWKDQIENPRMPYMVRETTAMLEAGCFIKFVPDDSDTSGKPGMGRIYTHRALLTIKGGA
ncbi:MAG: hypothetical protein NCW75_05480 [Phycisphaera sp.]|nr:MAG: hypothetical protein NCW75_05480 [Phycisphaera sp.]